MRWVTYFNRPEYVLQPWQIYRRWRRPKSQQFRDAQLIELPWGAAIAIRPSVEEVIERSLWVMGIYDLALSEALWRLLEPGELALDVGANLGYATSLMAARVGASGRVIAFEPNPEVYAELAANRARWQGRDWGGAIALEPLALSDTTGTATLQIPRRNRGEAVLLAAGSGLAAADVLTTQTVEIRQLDDYLGAEEPVGLLKIDIEGHELAAFRGAAALLARGQVRDIIFEEHGGYPSPAASVLEDCGYQVFRLWKGFWRPQLHPPEFALVHPWEPPNYLATRQPQRAIARLRSRGWQVLRRVAR